MGHPQPPYRCGMAKPGMSSAMRAAFLGLAALAAVAATLAMASAILKARQMHRIAAPLRNAGPEELHATMRRLLGSGGSDDGSPAPAPAPAPAANSSQQHILTPLPGRSDPKANCLQGGWEVLENAVQEGLKTCVYGNWCGQGCTGTGGSPIDNLDQACQEHDACLAGTDLCHECACHKALVDRANYIHSSEEKGCGCFNIFCWETDKVITAEIVAAGIGVWMSVRGCGSEPYGACPEPSPSPSPDTSSSTSSSSTTSRSPSDSDTSCPYDVSEGYDLKGGDLEDGVVSVTDEAECCSICYDRSECYAWVYATFNDACNGPCCFLKDESWTEYVEDSSLVAGTYSG